MASHTPGAVPQLVVLLLLPRSGPGVSGYLGPSSTHADLSLLWTVVWLPPARHTDDLGPGQGLRLLSAGFLYPVAVLNAKTAVVHDRSIKKLKSMISTSLQGRTFSHELIITPYILITEP